MTVRLQLFGVPTLVRDGIAMALPFERRSQMMVWLALRTGWVGRGELAALLWPDVPGKAAAANLRKSLFRLQGLEWGASLESQGGSLRVELETDVQAFERAIAEQRTADALGLCSGPLLAGFDDDANEAWTGWLRFERERLRAAWRGAALERLAGDIDATEGLQLAQRLLEADPLDEAALQAQMERWVRAGQAPRARQAYADFAARLADELGIEPNAALQALHASLDASSPTHAASSQPRPLPLRADRGDDDGFIGRAAERRQLAELLARDDVRLLCLTGPGGIGKTRLARRVAADLAGRAVFVALDDVSRADDLALRIARECSVPLRGRQAVQEQLAAGLAGRRLLLVLDNFEQLAGEARWLESLLAACPQLQLLVTSRVRLGLAAEHLLPLEGLPCPEPEDVDEIDSFDAARLFIGAARRVAPSLRPAAEAAAIVDICRQVDGLPLALELAAAWTRMLSCAAIAAELRAGSELLRATDASRPARHASIEQVFEQSWRRLADAEREALARLSVFAGGFSPEAARAVAAAPLTVLGALADKSLLRKDGARLSLHPLVQQLAAGRLGEESQAAARSAHADHFHRVLDQHRLAIDRSDRDALRVIDLELENCRGAWRWSIEQGRADRLRRSAPILQRHYDLRGRFEAGRAVLGLAIDAPALQDDASLQMCLLGEAAQFEYRLDRYAEAVATAQRALALADRADPEFAPTSRLRAINVLAVCALRSAQLDAAREHFTQVHDLAVALQQPAAIAASLDHLALVEKQLGRYDEALRLTLDSLAQHRRIGDSAGVALCLNNLASHYLARQDADAAHPLLREAMVICERDGLVGTLGLVLSNLTEIAQDRGEYAEAEGYAARAMEVADSSGNRVLWSWVRLRQAQLLLFRGEQAAAWAAFGAGLEAALAIATPSLGLLGLYTFATLLHGCGDIADAARVMRFGSALPGISAPMRSEMQAQLGRWGQPLEADDAWPGLTLDELLQRLAAEAGEACAPVRALLATSRRAI